MEVSLNLTDPEHLNRELAYLLTSGNCSCSKKNKVGWRRYQKSRYKIKRLKKMKAERYDTLLNSVIGALDALDRATNE